MLPNGWSDGSVGIGAAAGTYLCCRHCRRGDSCFGFGNNDFFCNERDEGFYDGEEEEEKEEEIKKNQEETKGFRSGIRRTKDEAVGNVVIFVGFGAEFWWEWWWEWWWE